MSEESRQLFSKILKIGIIASIVLVAVLAFQREREQTLSTMGKALSPKACVVIDAGHGGEDPGKVGINGALEKDINLEITKRLKTFLEQNDIQVVLTREEDVGLHDPNASQKKVQDMQRRVAKIEEVNPDFVVSIHQNSYHQENITGAQVFYYDGSSQSQMLAKRVQDSMRHRLNPENHRQVKANDSYYLLRNTSKPIVIVECGFLSNATEADLLITEQYQEKVAWSIHMGILQFINDFR